MNQDNLLLSEEVLTSLSSLNNVNMIDIITKLVNKYGNEAAEIVKNNINTTNNNNNVIAIKSNKDNSNIPSNNNNKQINNKMSIPTNKTPYNKLSRRERHAKEFDISRYHQRHIAFQVQYEGGPYYGFASQAGEICETVEKHLFDSLLQLRLIENRQVNTNYVLLLLLLLVSICNY
jgi:hypothetical protein